MNNTRVFRFLSIALLAAIALYFAAQGYFALTDVLIFTVTYLKMIKKITGINNGYKSY